MEQKEMQSDVHIGKKIAGVLAEKKMIRAELGRALGISAPSVSYMLERDTMDVKTLARVSRVLKHNFLKYYYVEEVGVGETGQGKVRDAKDDVIDGLKDKIALLEKEIDGMKRDAMMKENEYLRKINSLLERK